MKHIDLYWMSNSDWWFFENMAYHLRDDAPEDAKKSFEHYLKQIDDEDTKETVGGA